MERVSKNKRIIFITVVCALLLAVAFTSAYQPDTYSKFTSVFSGTSTSGKVAVPVFVVTPVEIDIDFETSEIGTYRFSVANYSGSSVTEVAYNFKIRVTMEAPVTVTPTELYVATNNYYTTGTLLLSEGTYENGSYYYSVSSMNMPLTSSIKYYYLNFEATDVGETSMEISVIAEQID